MVKEDTGVKRWTATETGMRKDGGVLQRSPKRRWSSAMHGPLRVEIRECTGGEERTRLRATQVGDRRQCRAHQRPYGM